MFLQGFLVTSSLLVSLVNGSVKVATLQPQPVQPVATLHASAVQGILLKPVQVNGVTLHPNQVHPTVVKTWTVQNNVTL